MKYKNYVPKKQIRLSTYLLLSSVSFATFAFAQNNNIVIDQAAHQGAGKPSIVQSSNGTDVLNIVKPTAGGVSHNKFLEYNVSDQNLILNNLTFKTGIPQGESTLGGTVAFNPNFGTGDAARVILNEVTSNSTTALEGYTEIFGQRAALVIANPNGITATGAGFINLSRLTMVTGKPNVADGKLQDFEISPVGIISIEGKGEQAFGLHVSESPAELVANTVKVAGNIYVDEDQELSIKTGNDKYDYNTKQITSKSDTTQQATLALDSTALGGMYAGRIKIEATQSGMGIKTDGNLVADMDNLEITADGDIVFKNVAAQNNIKITSKSETIKHQKESIAHAEKDIIITAEKNIQLDGTAYASNNISIKANDSFEVKGTIYAENNIGLTAQKDVALEGDFILSDTLDVKAGNDIQSEMQVAAVTQANIVADHDFVLGKEFLNANMINIETKNNIINSGKLVADTDLNVNIGGNLTNNDTILAQNIATLEVGGNSLFDKGSVSAKNLSISSGALTNNADIVADETLTISTLGDITNNSKIISGTDTNLTADNIHNLGQIAANGSINIYTKNDYINHRDSGLLAGADVIVEAGKDIINYLAEIFAGNNIELKGKDAKIGEVDPNKVYDNPNVENKHTSASNANNEQEIHTGEIEEDDGELDITLTELGITLTLPADAFAEEPKLGDKYVLDGYTIYIGERTITPADTPDGEPTVSFKNIDKLTILDANGKEVAYTLWDEVGSDEDNIEIGGNTEEKSSETIQDQINNTPYESSQDQFNALVNIGGRIESLNDITITSDKLYNMGFNLNTGKDGYSTYYSKIRDSAPYNAGWLELGRYKISEVHLDAEAGTILAGHNLNINTRDILNQSSTFSAKNNAIINTEQLRNQTYSEIVSLAIKKQRRTKKKKNFRTKKKTYNATEYYNERIYSKEASLVTAGNNLVINATGGNVINDQVEAATGSFRFGRDETPEIKSGQVPVSLTLPRGDNGMFAVSDGDPKYMIRSNVDFLSNTPFVGSDYFFDRITPFSNEYNTRKMLGDPAYETRLVMDAIRKATYGHYLGNGEISNDLDQMKALYNNAADEYERLGLKIGVALTAEQIAQLNTDIIWYVEKEVNGQKVLVPELYLCQATLDDIEIGGYGAKMTGGNVAINADTISNSGDIYAKNELALKAKNLLNESNRTQTARIIGGRTDIEADTLINRSATIGGEVTTIKANDILNETKKYTEETRRGKNYDLIEKTGQEAVISGNKGLQIEASGTYAAKGAKLESKEGDVSLKAENIILDTVELHNREERSKTKSGFMSKKTTTTVKDKIENVGSAIVAGGNAIIDAVKDIFSKGSKVEAGKDAQITAGGNITAVAAEDSQYSYSKTKKSSWGGLKKSLDEVEHEEKRLKGSNIKTTEGLTVVSGKDTTLVASNIEAGKDVNILAGYKAGEDGKLEKSGEQGSVNILNGEETTKHREVHQKTDLTKGFTEIAKIAALNAVTGGMGAVVNGNVGFKDGKLNMDIELGKETKDTWDNVQKNTVSANITAGGDINIGAVQDVNIKGSNIISDNNINITAEKNINITSSQSTEDDKKTHSESKISATAGLGNSVVDASYAIKNLVEATEDVKKAKDNLDRIEKLYSEGKASSQAVKDARINLAFATETLAMVTAATSQAMAKSGASAETLGFYVDAGITSTTKQSQITSASVQNTGSNIVADKNISFAAGEDMKQIGSVVISKQGSISYDIENNLILEASRDTYGSSYKTQTSSVGVGISTAGGVYADLGQSNAQSRMNGAIYNNSETIAEKGNINYNIGNDMKAEGYNAVAKNVAVNVGGDMNLSSMQNTDYAKNTSNGFGLGIGQSQSISISQSEGETDRRWVDNVSGIIGTESVDVNVGGKLSLEGAVIANIDNNGIDTGNLNIKAGSLEYRDIYNYEHSENKGLGFGTSTGTANSGKNTGDPNGTTRITITNQGYEKEGVTHATIGQGNIEVADGSDISGINRDVNNIEEITKDQITGALDATITIDNRLLGLVVGDTSGAEAVLDDITNITDNALIHADNTRNLSGTLVDKVHQAQTNISNDFGKDSVITTITNGILEAANTAIGAAGGVISTFLDGDKRSVLLKDGKEASAEDLTKTQTYIVNGIMNSRQDAENTSKNYEDVIVRYNPSYGFAGDLFEAAMGKLFGGFETTSGWVALNQTVAGDLETRKDMNNANNIFHSQGTIIGRGAGTIIDKNNVKIDSAQSFTAVGPAVSMKDWYSTYNGYDTGYDYKSGDIVRIFTTLDGVKNPSLFWLAIKKHSLSAHDADGYLSKTISNKSQSNNIDKR